jgi:dCMP deaminase
MSSRLLRDELFMQIAELVAQRGTCPRASVGALLVKDRRIVSMGYNGAAPGEEHCTDVGCILEYASDEATFNKGLAARPVGCKRAVHAEANALMWAARAGVSTEGCKMYCTHSPCPACARLIAAAGIHGVLFKYEYRDLEGLNLLDRLGVACIAT